jgi:hypothetical protein
MSNKWFELREGINRRDFVRTVSGIAATSSMGMLLSSCLDSGDPAGPETTTGLFANGGATVAVGDSALGIASPNYLLQTSWPSTGYVLGSNVSLKGKLVDKSGRPIPGQMFGVEDGLAMVSRVGLKTDASGTFTYSTTVKTWGAARVVFIVRDEVFPYIFQASRRVGNVLFYNSMAVQRLSVQNTGTRDLAFVVQDNYGHVWKKRIAAKTTTAVLTTPNTPSKINLPSGLTVGGGGSMGLSGGVWSVATKSNNEGVVTGSASAGEGLLRGKIYARSSGDYGACWAPGLDLGFLKVELTLCIGSDGISVGAGGSAGVGQEYSADVSYKLVNW